jgi:hypothetical protein
MFPKPKHPIIRKPKSRNYPRTYEKPYCPAQMPPPSPRPLASPLASYDHRASHNRNRRGPPTKIHSKDGGFTTAPIWHWVFTSLSNARKQKPRKTT